MAAGDYDQLKTALSPSNKVKWIVLKFLERWVKIDAKNAPDKKRKPTKDEVGIDVAQSDARGAELSVNVVEVMEKYGIKTFDVCEDGLPLQYDIPARAAVTAL